MFKDKTRKDTEEETLKRRMTVCPIRILAVGIRKRIRTNTEMEGPLSENIVRQGFTSEIFLIWLVPYLIKFCTGGEAILSKSILTPFSSVFNYYSVLRTTE